VTLLAQAPARAGGGGGLGANGDSDTSDPNGPKISATAQVRYNKDNNGSSSDGSPAGPLKAAGNWSPPACWYVPYYTPAQLKAADEYTWGEDSPGYDWKTKQQDYYANGKPYTDFNMAKTGQGYWWYGYTPRENYALPGASSCNDSPFWVDKGDPPPPGHQNVITPEILAELAYRQILIPTGKAATNPAVTQTVNLQTWVWLDPTVFHPVSVTAYITDYNVTATTTATPVGIHIDPGTPDARVFPSSGDCVGTGTPYQPGDRGDPPCGVTYLRPTNGATYPLTVTVTWSISWTGTGQPTPKHLADGTFGRPQAVTVREIQTVNR
jgi:enoyl reductase